MHGLLNGQSADSLALTDRALHYGDGLFETIAIRHGQPELWSRHWARLQHGAQRLGFQPLSHQLWYSEAQQLCQGVERGVLKLLLSRGSGGRGYRPPQPESAQRLMLRYPWPDYPADYWHHGVRVCECQHPVSLNPRLAGLKHLNRLDQVLARAEWQTPEIAEGLMYDPNGWLIEGTLSNVWLMREGKLYTPALTDSGIAGIMRQLLLEQAAALGLTCHVQALSRDDLLHAEAVWLSNSLIGLWPVVELVGVRHWPISELTSRLQTVLEQARCAECF